ILPDWLGHDILAPGASAILGESVGAHLSLALNFASPLLWLSALTWVLSIAVFRIAVPVRTVSRRLANGLGWTADSVFDAVMFGLIRFSGAVTRALHHGQLEFYLVVVFFAFGFALFGPMLALGGFDWLRPTAE